MQVTKKRRMEKNHVGVVSAKNSRARYLRSGTLYGGTLSLEQKVPERQKLMKLLLGVTIMSPEIRMALDAMGAMWSVSTWRARARIWERLSAFCTGRGIRITALHAVTFLASLQIRIQAKLTYARTLASILNLAGENTNPLKFYVKSLMAEGATEPCRQMEPLTQQHIQKLRNHMASRENIRCCCAGRGQAVGPKRQR